MLFNEVHDILNDKYQIEYLLENDKDAVVSRITYVQYHENQMRFLILFENFINLLIFLCTSWMNFYGCSFFSLVYFSCGILKRFIVLKSCIYVFKFVLQLFLR